MFQTPDDVSSIKLTSNEAMENTTSSSVHAAKPLDESALMT